MPGYFERKRREHRENPIREIDREAYGSVIGVMDLESARFMKNIRYDMVHAGVRKILTPFEMEILLIRDYRNSVTTKLKAPTNMTLCWFGDVVIFKGEKKSRLRHKLTRLAVQLRGHRVIDRYEDLINHGFLNLGYKHGPVLMLKENPTLEDLRLTQKVFESYKDSPIYIEREVWAKWR